MALDKEDKNFKALINKEFTSPTRKFYQEVGTDTINMHAREVWTQEVDSDPATAVTDGVAKLYTSFSLTADPTYPTECYGFFSSSAYQRNFISDKYGSDYEVELYDDSDTRIYKTDDIDWVFDYQTGILNIGEPSQVTSQGYSTPFKITAYQYIGATLSQSVGASGIISAEWDGSRDGSASITGSLYVTDTISGSNITGSVISASNFYGDGSGITGVTAEWDGSHVGNASITGSLYVTQTVSASAFTGSSVEATTITGSVVSASNFYGDGSGITGVTAEWDGSHVGNASITGSLYVTQTVSASAITGSSVEATTITGSIVSASNFYGDGSGITGVTAEWDGSHVGNASITGSLYVTQTVSASAITGSSMEATTITGSVVSASNFYGDGSGITGVTAEWDGSHVGNASITGSLYVTQTVSASAITGSSVEATTITGSVVSASNFYGDGSGITGVTAEWDGSHVGNASITGSLYVTQTVSASAITGSTISASNFYGDGSSLTGINVTPDIQEAGSDFYLVGAASVGIDQQLLADSSNGPKYASASDRLEVYALSASGDTELNGALDVAGNATFDGNVTLGNAGLDKVEFKADISSSLLPSDDDAFDLGAPGSEWKDLHVNGTASIDSLDADTAKVGDLTSGRIVLAGTGGELEDNANLSFDGTALTVTGDITASANISASAFYGDGSGITGVTAEWDGSHDGNAEITGSLTVKDGHINLTSSGGNNHFRGFFGFPRVEEVSSSMTGVDATAQELYNNSGSYPGYAVYIVTGSTPALGGTFALSNKFYFNENGVWHPSPFYFKV